MYGTEEFAAIINPPQAAILAVGAAREEPVVDDGARRRSATVMRVTLSVDHRPVDGVVAARWLAALTELLEHPPASWPDGQHRVVRRHELETTVRRTTPSRPGTVDAEKGEAVVE